MSQKEVGVRRRATTRHTLLTAAFELLGRALGTSLRVDEICAQAKVVRATFYNHFVGMEELIAAINEDMSHTFNVAMHKQMFDMKQPEQRLAFGLRLYLRRARLDRPWGCAMVNISLLQSASASETNRLMMADIRAGMRDGILVAKSEQAAFDIAHGAGLCAMVSMISGLTPEDYPEQITWQVLRSLGVDERRAGELVSLSLDEFVL
jgi:AcrR family transcriptional regulator